MLRVVVWRLRPPAAERCCASLTANSRQGSVTLCTCSSRPCTRLRALSAPPSSLQRASCACTAAPIISICLTCACPGSITGRACGSSASACGSPEEAACLAILRRMGSKLSATPSLVRNTMSPSSSSVRVQHMLFRSASSPCAYPSAPGTQRGSLYAPLCPLYVISSTRFCCLRYTNAQLSPTPRDIAAHCELDLTLATTDSTRVVMLPSWARMSFCAGCSDLTIAANTPFVVTSCGLACRSETA
mmetsp:Transcript_26069/g.56923  ORF Transcript_26069/g.56923 Transcript_26069/m.56923 type:complete len:245 (-) Transcript_26069:649-1383(-)